MMTNNDNIPIAQAVPVSQGTQQVQYPGNNYGSATNSYPGQATGGFQQAGGYPTQQPQTVYVNEGTTPSSGETIDKFGVAIRHAFIRKVYGILSVQLLVTFGIVFVFSYVESIRNAARTSNTLFYGAFVVSIAALCCLACNQKAARTFPTNYALLGVFTVAEGLVVGVISARYDPTSVTASVGATAVIVFLLSLFACQTKYDFTGMGSYLYGAFWVIFIFGLFGIFVPSLFNIYAGAMVLLFCMYVIYDTQLIIGGSHKEQQFGVDDYVFAALSLYIDIVQIFLLILQLFGNQDG